MKREVIRVEPLSTYLENWKAPTSAVTRSGDTIYVSGFPPFDPETGKVIEAPIERQTELVLEQMKLCLETAGSSLENVLKCNVYCTSVEKFAAVNAIYARYFPKDPPARIFVCVPAWPGTWRHSFDGAEERDLPPGSYVFQPKMGMHVDACVGPEDCILFIHQHAKGDFIPKQ